MGYYTTNSLVKVRLRMVEMYLKKGKSSSRVAEMFAISRKTFFNWLKRYREYGISISPHGVYNVLKRRNLNRLPAFKEEKEAIMYEKKKPFEMVHIDVKYV